MVTRTQHPKVYFSNQLEELAHFLGKNLFAEGTVPFSSPKVIVPSHSMKVWMKNFFASKFGICISIEFQTALEALPPHFMPSSRELFFKIHQRLLDNPPPEFVISKKTTLFVSDTLSKLFYSYNWEGVVPTQLWQKDLWDHIFEKNTLSQTLQQESGSFAHLFGFVHLPKDYYDFFAKGGSHFYFMTPSAFFSEDLCSDRERIFLEKKMEGKQVKLKVRDQLIDLIKDVHPLLANFGKAGKALIQKFADTQSFLEENYVEAEGATTLQFLQRSLLHFETSEIIQGSDSSIQVLAASSKLREVEVLFDAIYQKRLENSSLQPKDFLVVCPDLESYFPYIQMVFKGSFSIHGICIDQRAQALSHFFG